MSTHDKLPSVILNGTKILTLSFRDVKLIDSLSFLPMSLEKFSSTFQLKELKKGFFPHLFNRPENFGYEGQIPAKHYYSPENFDTKKREEFDIWYHNQSTKIFNFDKELVSYCKSDVQLLKEGTLAFRNIILKITSNRIDPFYKCITIASLCHVIYRTLIMKPETIGIIPTMGFCPQNRTSSLSIQWLKFVSFQNKINIRHGKNHREFKIGRYFVDGYEETTRTVYEFNG